MAYYAVAQEIPGVSEDEYHRITERLGDVAPPGLILHASGVTPTGLRMIEVWESRAARDAFVGREVERARAEVRRPGDVEGEPNHEHFEIQKVERLIRGS